MLIEALLEQKTHPRTDESAFQQTIQPQLDSMRRMFSDDVDLKQMLAAEEYNLRIETMGVTRQVVSITMRKKGAMWRVDQRALEYEFYPPVPQYLLGNLYVSANRPLPPQSHAWDGQALRIIMDNQEGTDTSMLVHSTETRLFHVDDLISLGCVRGDVLDELKGSRVVREEVLDGENRRALTLERVLDKNVPPWVYTIELDEKRDGAVVRIFWEAGDSLRSERTCEGFKQYDGIWFPTHVVEVASLRDGPDSTWRVVEERRWTIQRVSFTEAINDEWFTPAASTTGHVTDFRSRVPLSYQVKEGIALDTKLEAILLDMVQEQAPDGVKGALGKSMRRIGIILIVIGVMAMGGVWRFGRGRIVHMVGAACAVMLFVGSLMFGISSVAWRANITGCGVEALAVASAWHGLMPPEMTREVGRSYLDRQGRISLADLARVALLCGFEQAVPASAQLDELRKLDVPFVAHVLAFGEAHFVLCTKIGRSNIQIVDVLHDGSAVRLEPLDSFGRRFTGNVLLLAPPGSPLRPPVVTP